VLEKEREEEGRLALRFEDLRKGIEEMGNRVSVSVRPLSSSSQHHTDGRVGVGRGGCRRIYSSRIEEEIRLAYLAFDPLSLHPLGSHAVRSPLICLSEILTLGHRYSNARAQTLYQTTYYDPFHPALFLPSSSHFSLLPETLRTFSIESMQPDERLWETRVASILEWGTKEVGSLRDRLAVVRA
jgi:hypothetical protein